MNTTANGLFDVNSRPLGLERGGGTPIAPCDRRIAPATTFELLVVRRFRRQPSNKRLKLSAPGLGRIAFVRQHTSMCVLSLWPARGAGRRSLSAIR